MPWLKPAGPPPRFEHPLRETGFALAAATGVMLIGIAYSRGWLFPRGARLHPIGDAIDQLIIYAPMPLLVLVRRQGFDTAWLPRDRVALRIGLGLVFAQAALLAYSLTRGLVPRIYSPANVSYLVQVLLEDVSMLASGVTAAGLVPLAADALLGVLVLAVLQRSRDVWWFWMVHFALDMTQFA